MKFSLFKKNKDELERVNLTKVEKGKLPEIEKPKPSGIKLPTPDDLFGRELTYEESFIHWFNETLEEKIANDLSLVERVEHKLELNNIPDEFLYICSENTYPDSSIYVVQFKSKFTKLLKDSHFKPIIKYQHFHYIPTINIEWDSSKCNEPIHKYNRIIDATILKEYELDDDEGFRQKFIDILDTKNKDKIIKSSEYNRELTIKLNTLDSKYIEHYVTRIQWTTTVHAELYPRYKNILNENGWEVSYTDNTRDIHGSWSDKAVIKLKAKVRSRNKNNE